MNYDYTAQALKMAYKQGLNGENAPCAGDLYLQWEKGYQIYKRKNN